MATAGRHLHRWLLATTVLAFMAALLLGGQLAGATGHSMAGQSLTDDPGFVAYLPLIFNKYRPPISDDFSNPLSGWPISDDEVVTRGYLDGEYRILIKQSNRQSRASRDLLASDFSVEVDARAVGEHTQGAYGLYFGLGGAGYYLFDVSPTTGRFRLVVQYYAKPSEIIVLEPHGAILRDYDTNRLKVVRTGSRIDLYANGQQMGSVDDSTFGQGYIGLSAAAFQANFETRFDDFYLLILDDVDAAAQAEPSLSAEYVTWQGE